MTVHKFPFSVAYADTDAGGIVYHGRYIEIAERARMKWLGGVAAAPGDVGFVIRELNIKYMRPLKLGDDFVVETQLTHVGAASLSVEQKFVHDGVICAILTGSAAYIGGDMRPKLIPDEISKKLTKGTKK